MEHNKQQTFAYGLFQNRDGTCSSRLIIGFVIVLVSLVIMFFWAFSAQPKPEYVYKLFSKYISIVLPVLFAGQTAENYFRGREIVDRNKNGIPDEIEGINNKDGE
jgi:threonine/homoserine/homoserine lactone efflux protein